MSLELVMPFLIGVGVVFLLIFGFFVLFKAFYIKVPQGTALIVNDMSSTPKVHFTGALVYPVIYLKEFMRISLITLEVDRRGKDGLICKDNMRADITVAFYLRVNETQEDVLKVAKAIGVDRASDRAAVNELFNAKFSEALKTVGKQFDFVQLFENRQDFRDRIVETIGNDLNGYVLEDVAIDYLEQTAKASLDPSNILDADGIRKITELTAAQNVITNELERNEELAIKKKNVETREATLALERQQADAEARQKREIETIRAREEAETIKVKEEERLKAEQARIQSQQEIDVRAENHQREVEVAQQNRQRAVVIEVEKVTRAKDLEVVAREREVELQRIEAEKALEEQRKNIANVIRERVAVEKTVAQEEERIKEVREVSEAERAKQVIVLQAQAQAEQELVRQVKQAEADETRSKHKAVEINNLAQAELEAAAKQAEAKKRMAEGIEAERAAPGLADARVLEVTAAAKEKDGLAAARVKAEQADRRSQGRAGERSGRGPRTGSPGRGQGERRPGRGQGAGRETGRPGPWRAAARRGQGPGDQGPGYVGSRCAAAAPERRSGRSGQEVRCPRRPQRQRTPARRVPHAAGEELRGGHGRHRRQQGDRQGPGRGARHRAGQGEDRDRRRRGRLLQLLRQVAVGGQGHRRRGRQEPGGAGRAGPPAQRQAGRAQGRCGSAGRRGLIP